ncbi:Carcinoembryonic antigen-related cell adhesion molecule 1 [Galemys pyrenaicus]|uniref:Carcinoembryonic antigen-related cell adhesion molecule 1 n=1 Tax=Galemys pyrenaicus TaxID=202257 RepID=A0A8J5ZUL0_GALPY|nr:Carcinoembryonic antigen-related cell adhesion molecule 1 [Galemys pyrenaicus]
MKPRSCLRGSTEQQQTPWRPPQSVDTEAESPGWASCWQGWGRAHPLTSCPTSPGAYVQVTAGPLGEEHRATADAMEAPSAHGHKGRDPWQGILLAAVLPKPHITSNNSNPMEHKDPVALTCGPETQDTTYLWSIRGQSPPDGARLQLSPDNRTLTLLRVTRNDTGPYVCETRNPASAQRSHPLALNVLYGPDTPTISPSRDNYRAGEVLSLSCHAASHPPAQYSWLVNRRPQQASQELFIPHIAESDSGTYTCLTHNKATGLSSTTVKNIIVSESVTTPSIRASNTSVTDDEDRVVLACLTDDTGISTLWLFNNQRLQPTDRKTLSGAPSPSAPSGGRMPGSISEHGAAADAMDAPSTAVHKRWPLLAVSLSTFWILPTITQLTIESVPHEVAEGMDATLILHSLPEHLHGYGWYKGESVRSEQQIESYVIDTRVNTPGPAHSGQETISHDGSLLIPTVTQTDTGYYTLQVIKNNFQTQEVTGQIRVVSGRDTTGLSAGVIAAIVIGVLVVVVLTACLVIVLVHRWSGRTSNKHGLPEHQPPASTPASLLTVWTPPVTAELTVEPEPPNAAEGQDVLLRVRDVPGSPFLYEWFRGATTDSRQLIVSYKVESQTSIPGPVHSGRETVHADGSLLIRNVTRADTGNYTIVVTDRNVDKYRAGGQLHMYPSNTTVTEHGDCVVLTCPTNDTGISTLWLFNNQRLQPTDRKTLSADNSSLTISPVRREDAGEYQCEVSNLVSASRSDPITLNVKRPFLAGSSWCPWKAPGSSPLSLLLSAGGLSAGVIAAIVIGVLVVVVLAALAIVMFHRKSSRTSNKHGLSEPPASTPASLLTVWTPPVTAELTVEPEPPNAAEGQNVLLRVRDVPGNPFLYEWFRGATTDSKQLIMSYKVESQTSTPGHAHSGRETVRADGSLLIRSVTRADTGPYTLLVKYKNSTDNITEGQLRVYPSNTTVTEHGDCVVLTCPTNDTGISTLWLFNNQRLQPTDRKTLSADNSSLTISPVRREDAGEYQCEVSNLVSVSRSDPLMLTVQAGGDTTGLSAGVITAIVITVLTKTALAAALVIVLVHRLSRRTSDKRGLPEHRPPASTPGECHPDSDTPLLPLAHVYSCRTPNLTPTQQLPTARALPGRLVLVAQDGPRLISPLFSSVSKRHNTPLCGGHHCYRDRGSSPSWVMFLKCGRMTDNITQYGPPDSGCAPSSPEEPEAPEQDRDRQPDPPRLRSGKALMWGSASLLTVWTPPVTAELTVEPEPPCAAEGQDMLLRVRDVPGSPLRYEWFRGATTDLKQLIGNCTVNNEKSTPGHAHSSRETVRADGSLLIRNVTRADTGPYTLLVTFENFTKHRAERQLCVHQESSDSHDYYCADFRLPCHVGILPSEYSWLLRHLQRTTQQLFIHSASVTDNATYICLVHNKSTTLLVPTVMIIRVPGRTGISSLWLLNNQSLQLTDRVALSPDNHTLVISPVRREDPGSISVRSPTRNSDQRLLPEPPASTSAPVARPSIRASNTSVTEDEDPVVLACLTDDTGVSTLWLLSNQSLRLTGSITHWVSFWLMVADPGEANLLHALKTSNRASLLTVWNPPVTAKPTVEPEPPCAAEGQDVLLRVRDVPESPVLYEWFREGTVQTTQLIISYSPGNPRKITGPNYSNRETINPSGSLLIAKVTQADTGAYTLQVTYKGSDQEQATGQLRVYPSLLTVWTPPVTAELTVEPEPPNAAEGQDVLLRVRDVPGSPFLYEWFRGATLDSTQLIIYYVVKSRTNTRGPVYSGRETVRADGSLLIRKVSREDTGPYILLVIYENYNKLQAGGQLRVYPGGDTTGLSVDVIAAITIGGMIGVVLTACLVIVLVHRRSERYEDISFI